MPYNLFVIRTDGSEFKTLRSPYPDRADTVSTVCRLVETHTGPDNGRPQTFAERVARYPLNEPITHSVLGIGFRTEEI
jgi:hypothetical protein